MNCTEFDRHWQRRLDVGAGQTPVPLLTHLAECPRCQAWHRAWETLERAIDAGSAVTPLTAAAPTQPALVDRVLAELQAGRTLPPPSVRAPRPTPPALPVAATARVPVAWSHRRSAVLATAFTAALLVVGVIWLQRPLSPSLNLSGLDSSGLNLSGPDSSGPDSPGLPRIAITTPSAPLSPSLEPKRPTTQPAPRTPEKELASAGAPAWPGPSLGDDWAASESAPAPRMVKPLVGVVHNLTSLVLPGWPSVFNDSVGIPHCLDGEIFDSPASEPVSPPLPAPLVLVDGTELAWPEPVEELLAVATESVQTMWNLASRW